MEDTVKPKVSEGPKVNHENQEKDKTRNEEQRPPYPPYYQYPYNYPYYYQYPSYQRSPSEKGGNENNVCPTCGKSGYQYPYGKKESIIKKKFIKVPIAFWIVGLFFLIFFSCFIIAFISWPRPNDTQETYNVEVIIAQEGHFKYSLGYYLDDEITLNISSRNGENFDVYIMDEDQFENAYDSPNSSIISFSTFYSNENTNRVEDNLDFTDNRNNYKEYFLIIDNRDTQLTPDDATPSGTLTLDVEIITDYSYYYL
jgi:hypothetical protein